MNERKWTVGMPVYDFDEKTQTEAIRATFTAMALLTYFPDSIGEVVIVDNRPLPKSILPGLAAHTQGRIRYVPMGEPYGTMPPKNRVFEEAKFDHVVCIDSHVLLGRDFFKYLNAFYDEHGDDCADLVQGVLVTEAGHDLGTHFNDQWRGEMWGTWGKCFKAWTGAMFSVVHLGLEQTQYVTMLNDAQRPLTPDEIVALRLPYPLNFSGHEQVLFKAGCTLPTEPFKIPGQGMGMFACRKDAWLPFHPEARGFGGEEMTTHVRFRQAGRQCWCIPQMKWWHHFTRVGDHAPYAVTRWDKIRNYVLEFKRLGLDLAPLRQHFNAKLMPEAEWQQCLQGADWPDPAHIRGVNPKTFATRDAVENKGGQQVKRACEATGETEEQLRAKGIEQLFQSIKAVPSPIQADMLALRDLAAGCKTVVELGTHAGFGTTALLAGKPEALLTFHNVNVPHIDTLRRFVMPGHDLALIVTQNAAREQIPECDLLFVNTEPHDWRNVLDTLTAFHKRVRRYIAVHGSNVYGESHNGSPGVLAGLRAFVAQNQEWKAIKLFLTPSGLVVLSKLPQDVPAAGPVNLGAGPTPVKVPDNGPGTCLKERLASLGVNPEAGCECNGKMAQMNIWGVAGCRKNFNTIVGWLRDGIESWGWSAIWNAIPKAVWTGLAWKLNPLDPFPGLVNIAIKDAEDETRT